MTLVSGFLSDIVGISFPFIFTGILTIAVFLFYAPRGAEFFGGPEGGPVETPLAHEGAV